MTITVCSSMRNREMIGGLLEDLASKGVRALFPNLDFDPPGGIMTAENMERLQGDHFSAIRDSRLIYVLNPDGYIGRMVGIEIGYAKALGKGIIFSRKSGEKELDILADGFMDAEGLADLEYSH